MGLYIILCLFIVMFMFFGTDKFKDIENDDNFVTLVWCFILNPLIVLFVSAGLSYHSYNPNSKKQEFQNEIVYIEPLTKNNEYLGIKGSTYKYAHIDKNGTLEYKTINYYNANIVYDNKETKVVKKQYRVRRSKLKSFMFLFCPRVSKWNTYEYNIHIPEKSLILLN